MAQSNIEVTPLAGSMGALVSGCDLSGDLDNRTFDAVHQAFTDHLAIFFPDQRLTPETMSRFVARFGEPLPHPYMKPLAGAPAVHELRKKPEESHVFGNLWHMDFTNLPRPSLANSLYAREIPTRGGDTLFTNMYMAYEALSDGMKEMLDGMNAIHGFPESYKRNVAREEAKAGVTKVDADTIAYRDNYDSEVIHPVIRVHPDSGRKVLYVNPGFTLRLEGMTEEESQPILDYLYAHAVRPEFTFRNRWRVDMLGIWDNRCSMHYAMNDYPGQTRVMHRMVVLELEEPSRHVNQAG